MEADRSLRARELHQMLLDPVLRIRLEKRYYEITKSTHPRSDLDMLRTILEDEFGPHH
jgi:hypothetical protein